VRCGGGGGRGVVRWQTLPYGRGERMLHTTTQQQQYGCQSSSSSSSVGCGWRNTVAVASTVIAGGKEVQMTRLQHCSRLPRSLLLRCAWHASPGLQLELLGLGLGPPSSKL
jgi:hypothetical protein